MSSILIATSASADTILRQRQFDLTRAGDTQFFNLRDATLLGVGKDSEGLDQAQLRFEKAKSFFGRSSSTTYEDWSPYNQLSFKLSNRESFQTDFILYVYLYSSTSNTTNMFAAKFSLKPYETRRFVGHLNRDDAKAYGMKYMRPVLSAPFDNLYSTAVRDLRTIYNWRISYEGSTPARVDLSDLRLIRQNVTFNGMIDAFGQYTDRNWSDKVFTVDCLQARRAEELSEIDANEYLGELSGTSRVLNSNVPAGKWRIVTQPDGMKYFEHPSGKLFWVLGVSSVHNGASTYVTGRENFFQSLPATDGPFKDCYTVKQTTSGTKLTYSFTTQNLMLKYGADYRPVWATHVKRRLKSWGLNSIGMESMADFTDGSMPFSVIAHTRNFPTRLVVPKQRWGSFPDPYDANFESWSAAAIADQLKQYKGNPNLMGIYVDNELSWGDTTSDTFRFNVPLGIFAASATQPAKVATVSYLKSLYASDISKLNAAWGTTFTSFDSLLSGKFQPTSFNAAMYADFRKILGQFATTYFKKVRSALNSSGMNSLYLGCRFADWSNDVLKNADPYVDVHTFNFYRTSDLFDWSFINSLQRPTLISEVNYAVQGEGTFGGPGEVSSQLERAQRLDNFLKTAHAQPNVVGAILYCYNDQVASGRWTDGENAGIGLVDITDTPHYETVEVLRRFARNMYYMRGVDPINYAAPEPTPIVSEPTPEPTPEPIVSEPAPAPEPEPAPVDGGGSSGRPKRGPKKSSP